MEAGERSGVRVFLFYAAIFFGIFGILFAGFFALILAAWLSVSLHILSVQATADIAGIFLIVCLYSMFSFYLSKLGSRFAAKVGEIIEESIVDALHALREFPMQDSVQTVKFIQVDDSAVSFIPSAPFIPPRLQLA